MDKITQDLFVIAKNKYDMIYYFMRNATSILFFLQLYWCLYIYDMIISPHGSWWSLYIKILHACMCTLWKNTANTLCLVECLENYDQALLKVRYSKNLFDKKILQWVFYFYFFKKRHSKTGFEKTILESSFFLKRYFKMVLWKTVLDCRHSKTVFQKTVLEFSNFNF